MGSTYSLDRTIRYVRRFAARAPLTFTGTNDPALLMADWVRNMILGPPFAWRWNRATTSTTCVIGQQDYKVNLPDFGWIEQAVITDTVGGNSYQLEIGLNFTKEIVTNQSTHIAPWLDDNNGNITFRLQPPPDKTYTLDITYQKASPKFASLNEVWNPIPDYFADLIQTGFLAKAYELVGDDRYPSTMQLFVRSLVATNGGLTQSQVNIFLAEQLNSSITQQAGMQESQAAVQSRTLL